MRFVLGLLLCAFALQARAETFALNIPEQDLASALEQLSDQTGLQLLYPAEIPRGLRSRPISGDFSAEAALSSMLAGTGLVPRQVENTVVIERANGTRTIGSVQVIGEPKFSSNGSLDRYATESSGSYAAAGASIGSPFPQALKDTPRSVSVLTQSQLSDQNLTELSDALRQLPGVSVRGLPVDATKAYVRAFALSDYQIDSGAPRSLGADPVFRGDLDAYDRVELLRGSDGLGNGFASPAGVLNLVRKRPLDRTQIAMELQGGSWEYKRAMLDASAPLAWDGRLRGRTVLSGSEQEYFYDTSDQQRANWYSIVEAELMSNTVLAAGVHFRDRRATPWAQGGIVSLMDAESPIGRNQTFVLPWERDNLRSTTLFTTLEQRLAPDWTARLVFDHVRDTGEFLTVGGVTGGSVDVESGDGLFLLGLRDEEITRTQALADLKIHGRFRWLGLEQHLAIDVHDINDRQRTTAYETDQSNAFIPINIYTFDAAAYPAPLRTGLAADTPSIVHRDRTGGSVTLTLSPWTPLKIIGSYRWSADENRVRTASFSSSERSDHSAPSYLGLTYALGHSWSAYASWADVYESNAPFVTAAGRQLEPVFGSHYETGIKFGNDALNAAFALFRIKQRNLSRFLSSDPEDPFCCYDNGSNLRRLSDGAGIEVAGTPGGGVQLTASYSYNRNIARGSDATSPGERIDNETPRHLLQLWSIWNPPFAGWERLQVGGGVYAQSESAWRQVFTMTPDGPVFSDVAQGGYALFAARIGWRVDSHWSLAVNVENLFDRQYDISRGGSSETVLSGEPRSLLLTVRCTL